MISWSNTKSSEFSRNGSVSSSRRLYARKPVWYSDRCSPKTPFSTTVRKRLATNFHHGMPPDRAVPLSRREPSTMSARPSRIGWIICGHERRVVLVVGVDHDHHVGAAAQRFEVARLLVAAVAAVLDVDDHLEAEPLGDVDRLVVADVVDQDHFVDHVHGQPAVSRFQRPRGVVRGHDHHDSCAVSGTGQIPFLSWHGAMVVGKRRPASVCSPALECTRQS